MSKYSYYGEAREAYDEGQHDRYSRNPYDEHSFSHDEEQAHRAFDEGRADLRREEERREERQREEVEQEAQARRSAYEEAAAREEWERENPEDVAHEPEWEAPR